MFQEPEVATTLNLETYPVLLSGYDASEISLENLSPGIYTIHVEMGQLRLDKRIVKH